MKYEVNFSCGHTETTELFGPYEQRRRKIAWFEECGICSKCYKERKEIENSIGCNEVEMFYGEFKKNYSNCKTKAGSYNGKTKTIVVYVPVSA